MSDNDKKTIYSFRCSRHSSHEITLWHHSGWDDHVDIAKGRTFSAWVDNQGDPTLRADALRELLAYVEALDLEPLANRPDREGRVVTVESGRLVFWERLEP